MDWKPRVRAAIATARRRWRLTSAIAAVAVLAFSGVLALVYREALFEALNDPGRPFQVWEPPPAPDYATPEAWALLPGLTETDRAAVFFIHPTTYSGGGNWNAPIDKALARRRVDRVMIPNYAAPFASAGPVFAPRYRQASLYSMMANRDDARRARQFAYEDVERAFEAFLARIGEDTPFIVAGVEQGGLHAAGLLRDRVAKDEDLVARLIAAYVIDYPLPDDLFYADLAALHPCRTETDFRCVVSWASVTAEDERRARYLTETLMMWGPADFVPIAGRRLLCTNPLLWNTNGDYAPARLNRGAVAAEGLEPGVAPSPAPGQIGAQCQDGLLIVDRARSARFRRPTAVAERYRAAPFNLFYEDIRANAQVRAQAALERIAHEETYAAPITQTVIIGDAPVNRVPD